jgi:hypothetical protein
MSDEEYDIPPSEAAIVTILLSRSATTGTEKRNDVVCASIAACFLRKQTMNPTLLIFLCHWFHTLHMI